MCVSGHNWREGYHAVEGKLKEVFHTGIITHFITDSLVLRVFRGAKTYCVVLRLQEDIVHFFSPFDHTRFRTGEVPLCASLRSGFVKERVINVQ